MKISQQEAHRMRKRITELEEQIRQTHDKFSRPYSGVQLFSWAVEKDRWYGNIEGAIAVGKVIVVRIKDEKYDFYAC